MRLAENKKGNGHPPAEVPVSYCREDTNETDLNKTNSYKSNLNEANSNETDSNETNSNEMVLTDNSDFA